jgi:hypothetical protein
MPSLSLEYGTGFIGNANGGIAIATGWDETRQHLERIAFTVAKGVLPSGIQVPPEYIGNPTFGLSLRLMVGQLLAGQAAQQLAASIKSAASSAPGTNPNQPPDVVIAQTGNTFQVTVTVYLSGGQQGRLTYQVS